MTKRMLILKAAPFLQSIIAREAITLAEKEEILDSIDQDPERSQAKSILANIMLSNQNCPDVVQLYDLLKES